MFQFFWPWGIWDLSSSTRDGTLTPALGGQVLTTRLPGKSWNTQSVNHLYTNPNFKICFWGKPNGRCVFFSTVTMLTDGCLWCSEVSKPIWTLHTAKQYFQLFVHYTWYLSSVRPLESWGCHQMASFLPIPPPSKSTDPLTNFSVSAFPFSASSVGRTSVPPLEARFHLFAWQWPPFDLCQPLHLGF